MTGKTPTNTAIDLDAIEAIAVLQGAIDPDEVIALVRIARAYRNLVARIDRDGGQRFDAAPLDETIKRVDEAVIKMREPYTCKHCGLSTANPKGECIPCAIL